MPIFRAKSPSPGDNLSAVFEPPQTGGPNIQIRINALTFHHDGVAKAEWDLFRIDPMEVSNRPIFLSTAKPGPSNDLTVEGMVLATEQGGESWGLGFNTRGIDGTAFFVVDYDFVSTEG